MFKYIPLIAFLVFGQQQKPQPFKPDPTAKLTVHEWGVAACTSGGPRILIGASGPADDDLPPFITTLKVQGRNQGLSVRQPLIYITSDKATDVSISIRFGDGYPTCFDPPATTWCNTVDMKTPGKGSLAWNCRVDPAVTAAGPEVPAGHWIEACRNVDSTPIRVGTRTEKYLFYEGVVPMTCPLSAEIVDGRLHVSARQDFAGTAVAVWDRKMHRVGPVKAGAPVTPEASEVSLQKMLEDAGLTGKEAGALLAIWQRHFERDGLRLLVLKTGEEYDALLPIEICPKPVELKRVLVLSIDFPTPPLRAKVDQLVADLAAADIASRDSVVDAIRRLGPIASDPLSAHGDHEDPEVRSRVKSLLEGFKSEVPVPAPGPNQGSGLKKLE